MPGLEHIAHGAGNEAAMVGPGISFHWTSKPEAIRVEPHTGGSPLMDFAQCPCSGKNLDRLLRPTILGILAREKTHGYDLVQRLNELNIFSDLPPDASGVYKLLKSMEEEGLISANWEFVNTRPAKRSYALTKDGMTCLRNWAETLAGYRDQINTLLTILDLKKELPAGSRVKSSQRRTKCCGQA